MWWVLWTIIAVLFILWIIGLGVHWAVNIVWVLFIVAVALLIINLIAGLFTRRPVV